MNIINRTFSQEISALLILSMLFVASCSDSGVKHTRIVEDAIDELVFVQAALNEYKNQTERYPLSLKDLVSNGYLSSFPEAPMMGKSEADLIYKSDMDGSFYYLVVAYRFNTWVYHLHYVSYRDKWETTKYPPKMEDLVVFQYGQQYQESRSWSNLTHFVTSLASGGNNVITTTIYRSIITNSLGEGEVCRVPDYLNSSIQSAYKYDATNSLDSYVICYQPMLSKSLVTKEGVLGNTEIVNSIYRVSNNRNDGKGGWEVICSCPKPRNPTTPQP